MAGISNVTTDEFFEEEDDDFKQNFVGVFSSDKTTPFLNFLKMMKKSNLPGTHGLGYINIYLKKHSYSTVMVLQVSKLL